jgi:hypothetical protein
MRHSLALARGRAKRQEAEKMADLLILIGAILIAVRMTSPLLRIVISLLRKLVGFTLFIVVAILLVIALLTHGMFI